MVQERDVDAETNSITNSGIPYKHKTVSHNTDTRFVRLKIKLN